MLIPNFDGVTPSQDQAFSPPDWSFRGPSSLTELLAGIRSSGLGIGPYANHYVTTPGIGEKTQLAHELRGLFNALQHLIEYDHLDALNLAGAEFISRRILQIQSR